ncbi:MAG: FTR1 family protein [Candidatus Heimdallarchaeota archaeon]|nr:MAG: FTR1 family protein [Candidatus Heimdallarchaeota archaeon]
MAFEILGSVIFSFVTSLREVLEAALIIGIIASYLTIIDRKDLFRDILYGVFAAVIFSLGMAWVFLTFFTDLAEYQKLFEGIAMFLAAVVLSWMIVWMTRQSKKIRSDIQEKVDKIITNQEKAGIAFLVFISVAREGAELVLFLYASYIGSVGEVGAVTAFSAISLGFLTGLLLAAIMAIVLFTTTRRLDIKKFFQVTSVILIIFAAGLLAHGIHEIYEFLEISGSSLINNVIWIEVWNINNTVLGDVLQFLFGWSYDPLNPARFEKSVVGGIIVGLFGWNDNPALIEVLAYGLYYVFIAIAIKRFTNFSEMREKAPQPITD